MNISGNEESEIEKRNEESLSYRHSGISNDWQYSIANSSISSMGRVQNVNPIAVCGETVGPSCSSSLMVESFDPTTWEHPVSATLPLGFNEMNVLSGVSTSDPLAMLKAGLFSANMSGIMPPSLSHFPADSSFIERAARYSSFSRETLADTMNPFGVHQPANPHLLGGAMEPSPFKNATSAVCVSENNCDEAEFSGRGAQEDGGAPSVKGLDSKKRKRINHDADLEQEDNGVHQLSGDAMKNNTETQQEGEQKSTRTDNKSNGKHGKEVSQGSDSPKGDYIHVRARRGQATNSHSLAERVRREKISDRMKYLQDLVPGCNKVTGKAVMLDEIINYVQSLQRQVEFLSMKLATVSPSLDLNIAELLAKDQISAAAAPTSGRGFSPHMPISCPPLHPTQPPILKPGLPGKGNSSDALIRTASPQLANMGEGYKDPTEKMLNVWEDELHNIVQMGFNSGAPLENQEPNHLS